ncbi:MAG: anthranilate synthase component I family protein [Nitrospirota bacterium]
MLNIFPSREKFIEDAEAGVISPLYVELPFHKPQQIYERIESSHSFILESLHGPEKIARYSFLGAEPFLIFKVKNGSIEISGKEKRVIRSSNPLKALKELITAYKLKPRPGLPPFIGGAVGLISYDFVHYLEHLPRTTLDDLKIPYAHFMFVDTVIAIDHKLKKTFLISSPAAKEIMINPEEDTHDWASHYDNAVERISRLYSKIKSPLPPFKEPVAGKSKSVDIRHEITKKDYMDMVVKTKEYITAGDIFQANISQRVSAEIGNIKPWELYKALSRINPSPFAAYLNMEDYHIVSSSPERLVRVSEENVETRPIAGTRRRGVDSKEDSTMRAELLLDEKERAEHLMLIDLERNDLGKISDYSTVTVDELMTTEDYSHVMHIVSNIRGRIVEGKDSFDVIRAVFPGGTITGVPKVRCMEIIDELEPVARGPYTGSLGYISFTGEMDLNIIIRSFVIKDSTAYVQAGAGIVADSDPEREYYETLKKAEALIKTLEIL